MVIPSGSTLTVIGKRYESWLFLKVIDPEFGEGWIRNYEDYLQLNLDCEEIPFGRETSSHSACSSILLQDDIGKEMFHHSESSLVLPQENIGAVLPSVRSAILSAKTKPTNPDKHGGRHNQYSQHKQRFSGYRFNDYRFNLRAA
ncbi:MAG: hypothetical protein JXA25_18360 [Anaerolineales bacterium]|nr:hypothetical protein [Anaerolineales bacterium]